MRWSTGCMGPLDPLCCAELSDRFLSALIVQQIVQCRDLSPGTHKVGSIIIVEGCWAASSSSEMLEAGDEGLGGKIHHQLQCICNGGQANEEANITLDDDRLTDVALLQREVTGEVCSHMSEG